jgi:hypothetical protein
MDALQRAYSDGDAVPCADDDDAANQAAQMQAGRMIELWQADRKVRLLIAHSQ